MAPHSYTWNPAHLETGGLRACVARYPVSGGGGLLSLGALLWRASDSLITMGTKKAELPYRDDSLATITRERYVVTPPATPPATPLS